MERRSVSCVVLAAGKGTRMKSERAKVLHQVFFAPMILHVLAALKPLPIAQTLLVVGHQEQRVRETLAGWEVTFVPQAEQLGTGHAVLCAEEFIPDEKQTVLILCGDTPLIQSATLAEMLKEHEANRAVLTVMTTTLANPANYGRIIRDEQGHLARIVEEKDASLEEKKIAEINAGIYLADAAFLFAALKKVGRDNSQGEIYLTDIVELANRAGHGVFRFAGVEAAEVLGVNSRIELAAAHQHLQMRFHRELMLAHGVTIYFPETTSIQKGVAIGRDTTIYGGVHITGQTIIGSRCTIEPYTVLRDCVIGDDVTIGPFVFLDHQQIENGAMIGPQLGPCRHGA